MKLIEADKVKRVMKDYWKAQVDKALTLTFTDSNEANKRINSYLEHNHELLKAVDELPSAEPDTTTNDSIPAETGKNDEDRTSGDCISRRQAINKTKPWLEVKGYGWSELNMLRAVINELENMPSVDAVEVVRCKDCIWRDGIICRNNDTMPWSDNDFCSNAERRQDG